MKKIFLITFLMSIVAASVALAAVSSPCGARKPAKKEAPAPVERQQQYRRDILSQKVPVYTANEGDSSDDQASELKTTIDGR